MLRRSLWLVGFALVTALLIRAPFSWSDESSKPRNNSIAAGLDSDDEYYELFRALADTINQIEHNYVKDISRRELLEAAIEGMLTKLDVHSQYITPEELSSFKTSVESQFGGIGIQITTIDGLLAVATPLYGTPAYRAGMRAGDKILEIEGTSTKDISLERAVEKLKGKAGTTVSLLVLHPGETEPVPVNLTREVVHIETVLGDHRGKDDRWEFMLDGDNDIGYIRITSFSRDTTRDLRHALRTLTKRGLKGLVLDLRFNPGGLLSEAINSCDLFISEGTIVSTQGRNVDEHVWKANAAGTFEGFPIAVLVNHYSASASEILSACLQDHNRGIIIGERTWGKGSVQNVVELEGGRSALKLTTASYLRPSGKNIHRFPDSTDDDDWGVLPNDGFEVEISRRELEHLYRRSQQREVLIWHSPDSQRDSTKTTESRGTHENNARGNQDHQLQTALDYIREQLSKA